MFKARPRPFSPTLLQPHHLSLNLTSLSLSPSPSPTNNLTVATSPSPSSFCIDQTADVVAVVNAKTFSPTLICQADLHSFDRSHDFHSFNRRHFLLFSRLRIRDPEFFSFFSPSRWHLAPSRDRVEACAQASDTRYLGERPDRHALYCGVYVDMPFPVFERRNAFNELTSTSSFYWNGASTCRPSP